jgi:hypothetical protein
MPSPTRRPDAASIAGTTTSATLPGSIVERTATTWSSVMVGQRPADVLADPTHGGEVELAGAGARRADADEGHLGGADRRGRVGGGRQPAVGDHLGDQLVDPALDDRGASGGQQRHLGRVDVDALDPVALGGEGGGGDAPDVAEAEDGDAHRGPPGRRGSLPPPGRRPVR